MSNSNCQDQSSRSGNKNSSMDTPKNSQRSQREVDIGQDGLPRTQTRSRRQIQQGQDLNAPDDQQQHQSSTTSGRRSPSQSSVASKSSTNSYPAQDHTNEKHHTEYETDEEIQHNQRSKAVDILLEAMDMSQYTELLSIVSDIEKAAFNPVKGSINKVKDLTDPLKTAVKHLIQQNQRLAADLHYEKGISAGLREANTAIETSINKALHNNTQMRIIETIRPPLTKQATTSRINMEEFPELTYANSLNQKQKQLIRPAVTTIILKRKSDNTTVTNIREQLTQIQQDDIDLVNCTHLKSGNYVITCKNKKSADTLQERLQHHEKLQDIVEVISKGPQMDKIILFNVPVQCTQEELLKETIQQIQRNTLSVEPTIQINQQPPIDTTEDLTDQISVSHELPGLNGTKHVVIQAPLPVADKLREQGKLHLYFTTCSIKPFITVERCRKCKFYGHKSFNCRSEVKCGYCAGNHPSKQCTVQQDQSKHKCINCMSNTPRTNRENYNAKINHTVFAKNCPAYKAAFKAHKDKLSFL